MSSASAYVEEAANWAKELVRKEARFPGDHQPAVERVARRLKLPHSFVWELLYRRPKAISTDRWAALGAFYLEEQQEYRDWRSRVHAKTPLAKVLFGLADRVAGMDCAQGGDVER